ncbi:MAG TPA: phenylalanine--tRNA ligase subunit alpha [Acidimicrobiia bacterium]|nr:phenylalanine--tRNA ligase subunit alpha [Acidimicrobiia bacterium]
MNRSEAQQLLDDGRSRAVAEIESASDSDELAEIERRHVGRRSPAAQVTEAIKTLPAEDRRAAGKAVSDYKAAVAEAAARRRDAIASAGTGAGARGEQLDLTEGGHVVARGHLHLVTQVQRELEDIFTGLGYRVAEGPEVEDDWHNFEALNIPPAHPARSMQDTLYVKLGAEEQVMLRTHTSPVQIRTMEAGEPPIYVIVPGRTYRNETPGPRNSPVFHQMECLAVDHGLTLADLFGTIEAFAKQLFDDESVRTRFRSDYFPYTEPSAELAVSCIFCHGEGCRVCSHTGWIELGGCGMVDPNVFEAVGYDPEEWQGFAFGFGLERIAMIRYGIDEIRTFFEGDVRFLSQY